jgi:hypothetical protein
VARTKKAPEELMARDLSELDVAVLMIDGEHFAEHCCVVAMAITADRTKVPYPDSVWCASCWTRLAPAATSM